ncbi:hypothetical protein [Marispirochaeta sp.]|uniref:hypothetical protein n=1 Tax=Marispirochaeta sp. TaxID=2038653 RepID=UPI0029C9524E|nr:hypothetical protein [Marispirochaeta sp.]
MESRKKSKRNKVLAVSSGGGHWVQLLRLRKAWMDLDVIYATVWPESRDDVDSGDFFIIPDANRWTKIALLKCMFSVFKLVMKERPGVIISTGAAPGLFAIFFGKLTGARTLWLDSIANAEKISLSGKLAGYIADEWLTQWETLSKPKGPYYHGAVL